MVAAILEYRASVLSAAGSFERVTETQVRRTRLAAVPTADDAPDGPVLPISPRQG